MRTFLLSLGMGLVIASAAVAGEQKARIEVGGLWCPSCSFIVGEALKESASVEIIEFLPAETGESGVYIVSFDDELTNAEEIAAQPLQYGYTATVLSATASNS